MTTFETFQYINCKQTNSVNYMDIKERFQLFDAYVTSIDGLSTDVKRPLTKVARYAFEATTGLPAPVETDLAKKVGLLTFVRQIEDCLNPSNPQPLTDDIINQANNIALQIDELAADPDELRNDTTSTAHELVATLPNTDARINMLKTQLKVMRAKVAGFNPNMTRAQRLAIEKDLDKIQNEIALYMNLGKPYDRIRTSLNQFDQAKQNANYISRKATVNQMMMDKQLHDKKIADDKEAKMRAAKKAADKNIKDALANSGVSTNVSNPPPKSTVPETPPTVILSPSEQAHVDALNAVKEMISNLSSTQGSADVYDLLPTLAVFLQNVNDCRNGDFKNINTLSEQSMQVQNEMNDFMEVMRKELSNPTFVSNIQNISTNQLTNVLQEYGIDVTNLDTTADKEHYQSMLNQIQRKAQLNRNQLNNAKSNGAYYKDADGVVHYTDETIPEIIDDLTALSAQERDVSNKLRNLDKLQSAYTTIANVVNVGNWVNDVAHNVVKVQQDTNRANHISKLKIQPDTFLSSLTTRVNHIINLTTEKKSDIFTLLAAIKTQNTNAKLGRKSTIKNELKRANVTLDMTSFAVDQSGNFYFKCDGNLIIPLRVAYEMSVGGVTMSNNESSVILAEHLVTHPMVNGQKIERMNENWTLSFIQETPESEDAKIDITYKGNTTSTQQSMMSADIDTMLREGLVELGNTLPFCGEK